MVNRFGVTTTSKVLDAGWRNRLVAMRCKTNFGRAPNKVRGQFVWSISRCVTAAIVSSLGENAIDVQIVHGLHHDHQKSS
jgi:hypothetical protein